MIKAGTVWEKDGHQVEWQNDMEIGDPITRQCIKLDGEHPRPDSAFPFWFSEMLKTPRYKLE